MTEQLFEPEVQQVAAGYARVALEQGVDVAPDGLTYAVPEELADLVVGDRVIVPLGRGNKKTPGYVVERVETCDLPRVKAVIGRDRFSISLPDDLVELAKWIAGYYCCPLGMVFGSMLPAAVRKGTGTVTRTMIDVTGVAEADLDSVRPKLTKLQRAVADRAAALHAGGDEWVEIKELADAAGAKSVSPVKQLVEKGVLHTTQTRAVTARQDEQTQAAAQEAKSTSPFSLMESQQQAVDHLKKHLVDGFGVHLLHGVTGSGKTEVYLQLIEHLIAPPEDEADDAAEPSEPAGAIVLVPEIALTPQTMARFMARFDNVAVLHSGLSSAQRHEQWQRIHSGEARIVVGARSAVFAPLPRVGVIIVDEEHDNSYKQDQLPRYHARDVAIKRGQLLNVPVVLGSATPSLESYFNATDTHKKQRFHLVRMPDRVAGYKLPKVETVDMIEERRARRGIHLLSERLEHEVTRTLADKGQVMLLLNRRGYANYIACPDQRCGWMMVCEFCDATMVYHKDAQLPTGGLVRCHHCNAEQLLPTTCPTCSRKVSVFGLGTQRVEEEIAKKFGGARFLRMDSDVMRTGRDYYHALESFRRGEVDILVGTQMIAKGLDFPNVRLVGVISGDTSLHMPDFRASERTFQLIAQVAGRAGRSDMPGLVIVQSFTPQDPAIEFASRHDYDGFATHELRIRHDSGLPPVSRMARIVVRHLDHVAGYEHAKKLTQQLEVANDEQGGSVRVRGPMPCPIARIANYHRQQIELIAPTAGALQKLLTQLRNRRQLISDATTAVDVDPVALL